jgi:anti-anti-sigma regulatory factor
MKLYLIVANGKHKGMPIPIKIDLFLIGSDAVCQLRSRLPGIGPKHCALVTRDAKVFLRDLGSGEETIINGDVLPEGKEWVLHAGDRLVVGPLDFLIQYHEKQLSQRDMEEWALKCLDVAAEDEEEEDDNDADLVAAIKRRSTTASDAAQSILDKLQAKRGVVKGRLRISLEGGITILRFNDVYLVDEAEIALIKKELMVNLKKPTLRNLLDFKNVKRMSTAAAEMLVDVYKVLRERDVRLAMCRVRPELMPMIENLEILQPIPHYPDKETAIETLW